jgi:hypothetical protein
MYEALLEWVRSFVNHHTKGWPKSPHASKSAKVKVIILDKIVQLKAFGPIQDVL